MNPVSAPLTSAAALSLVPGQLPQAAVFQNLLNISVTQVDAQAVLQVDVAPIAEASVSPPALAPAVATAPEAQNWVSATGLVQSPVAESNADDVGTAEADKPKGIVPSEAAPVPSLIAQIRPQVTVPVPAVSPELAPQPRKKVANIETAKPLSDVKSKWLSSASAAPAPRPDTLRELSEPMLSPNADIIGKAESSFDTRFSINATAQSMADTHVPASSPAVDMKQLIIGQDGEWIGALARDIVSNAGRDNQLQFTLMPENLGQLDVSMTTDNGQVDIRLETSTTAAAQVIAADQARLIEDLRNAGLKLGQFDMSNRQNGNGQQQPDQADSQHTETTSTPTQTKASSKAKGRFA